MIKNKLKKWKNPKLDNIYKKEYTIFIKNPESIYPPLKGCKNGNKRLENNYNYLLSSVNYEKKFLSKKMARIYFKC